MPKLKTNRAAAKRFKKTAGGGFKRQQRHPIAAAHARLASRVTDGLVRISIGVEDWRDLLADFEQALGSG